jgi:hypothetical protein
LSTEDQEGRTTIAPAYSQSNSNLNDLRTNDENEDNLNLVNQYYLDEELERFNRTLMELQRPCSRALSVPAYFPLASMNRYTSSYLLSNKQNLNETNEQRVKTAKSIKSNSK